MPKTKAGKALERDHFDAAVYCGMSSVVIADAIDAIEAEAVQRAHAGDAAFLDDLVAETRAKAVAAERERIEPFLRDLVDQVPVEWLDPESSMAMQVTIRTRDLAAALAIEEDTGSYEYPDDTVRQNGPIVIGERCPWCGAMVLDSDHVRSHD